VVDYGGCHPALWRLPADTLFLFLQEVVHAAEVIPKGGLFPWIPTFDEFPIDYSKGPIYNPL
jgi:hypothetical protein